MKSTDRSPYADDSLETRASMDNASQASQIPLDPIIKKTTSVHISSGPVQGSKESKETLSDWKFQNSKEQGRPGVNPSETV